MLLFFLKKLLSVPQCQNAYKVLFSGLHTLTDTAYPTLEI